MQTQKQLTIEELSRKLKPIFGKKIDGIFFRYSMADSIEEKNEILHLLSALYQKHLGEFLDKKVLLEPPKQDAVSGGYPLSEVVYADKKLFPFSLKEEDWPRHVCISGMSGSGKTTLAFHILNNFIQKNKPFLVFDWKKSFRPLITQDASIMNFTIGNDAISNLFKMNINRPPEGVSPKEWINVLCDLLTESFQVSFGVHKILLETLDEIFEAWEIYKNPQEKKHYPNWEHVKKMLELKAKEASGRESKWYESALRIASVLTFGDFGKVINYDGKKSLSVEDLFNKKVVFELNSLGNIEKKFFCEFILTYIYKYKKSKENKINEKFDYAILVDEAHNIFLKDKTNFVSESITDRVYREMREYGTSLICLDQHVSKLSDTVKGNSACHIAFQQQLPQDIYEISSLMQLQDRKEFFSQLPVGQAIVKLAERHTSPFLVQVPFVDLRSQTINDEKIKSRTECLVQGIEVQKDDSEFLDSITIEQEVEHGKWKPKSLKTSEKINTPKIGKGIVEERPQEKIEINLEIPEIPQNKVEESKIEIQIPEPKVSENKFNLTSTQEVLFDFVLEQIQKGKELKQIEKTLETGLCEKLYNSADIMKVIDCAFEFQFNRNSLENSKIKTKEIIPQDTPSNNSDNEEKAFLDFLEKNPAHEYTTVQLYKILGFSPRKGNTIKNKLLDKKLITIEEQKNLKGWKKFIRLSHNIHY